MKKALSLLLSLVMVFTIANISSVSVLADSKPATTQITSLKSGVKSFTVKWNKKNVDGYQIMYSTSSKFKNSKKKTINKGTTTSKKISKLKAKKKYYVKVRTFKGNDDKRKYSSWSKVKSVTTKADSKPKTSKVVYITPTGKKYHFSKDCAGPNAIKTDLDSAKKNYDPCKKCANG